MVKPEKNKIYRVTVDGYASEGEGVARLDGRAVFIRGALRGEVCDVHLLKVEKPPFGARQSRSSSPLPRDRSRTAPTFPYAAAAAPDICLMKRSCTSSSIG
jgi:23S rRNA (uracil1939-C5)-methyltransferase